MTLQRSENVNIASFQALISPEELKAQLPLEEEVLEQVLANRQAIRDILDGRDHRVMVVVGPCSIHDEKAALEYAERLKALSDKVSDTLLIVMRVYFEKPRTSVGWKGFINDPDMDDTFKIEKGLYHGRKLLLNLSKMGLPTSTEALDPISPQYMHDIISWSAIGARTTESQTHREMSSGLSSPVGFKNGTDGGLTVAINALQAVSSPHRFLGIDPKGKVSIIFTNGNPYAHIVLRGGNGITNFDAESVSACEEKCKAAGVTTNIMIDCSHANSGKKPENQPAVLDNVVSQIEQGNQSIIGVMLESHLKEGRQDIPEDLSRLEYGKSVTDACIDWETTEHILMDMHDRLQKVLPARKHQGK